MIQGPSTLEPTVPVPVGTVPVGNSAFLKLLLSSSHSSKQGSQASVLLSQCECAVATFALPHLGDLVLLSIALPSIPYPVVSPRQGPLTPLSMSSAQA